MANTQQAADPYWLVWRLNGESPKHKHATFELADAEAQRLARTHRGAEFVVLETVRSHQASDLVSTDLRPDRGIPF